MKKTTNELNKMKKIYPSKELSIEEPPISFKLQRRPTIKEDDNEEIPNQRPPFSRSTSTACMYKNPNPDVAGSTIVITESELSSSWLYKNKKEQMNNNNESFTKSDSEKMAANKEENTPRLHQTKLKSTSIDQGRSGKSKCCRYTTIILGLCFASLVILAAVAGIVWMELFTSTESTTETDTSSKTSSGSLNAVKKLGKPISDSRSIADGNDFNLLTNHGSSITLDDLSSGSIAQMFPNQVSNMEKSEEDIPKDGSDTSTNGPAREQAIPSIISGVTSFFVKNLEQPKAKTDEDEQKNQNQNIMVPIRNLFNMNGSQNLVNPIRNFFNMNRSQNLVNPIRNLFNPSPNSPYSKLFELYSNLRNENREKSNSTIVGNLSPIDKERFDSHLGNSNLSEDNFDKEFEKNFEDFDVSDVDWENSFDFEKEKQIHNVPEKSLNSIAAEKEIEDKNLKNHPEETMLSTDFLQPINKKVEKIEVSSNNATLTDFEKTLEEKGNQPISDKLNLHTPNIVKESKNEDVFEKEDSFLPGKDFQHISTFKASDQHKDNLTDQPEFNTALKDLSANNSVGGNIEENYQSKQIGQFPNKDSKNAFAFESVNKFNEDDQSMKPISKPDSESTREIESVDKISDIFQLQPMPGKDSETSSISKSIKELNEDDHFEKQPQLSPDSKSSFANEAKNESKEGHLNQPGNVFNPDVIKSKTFENNKVDELSIRDQDYDPQNVFTFETIEEDDEDRFSNMEKSHLFPELKNTEQIVNGVENQISNKNSESSEAMQPVPPAISNGMISDNSDFFESFDIDDDTEHNLKNSDLNEEFNWGRPIFETAVPAAVNLMSLFTRRAGSFEDTDSKSVDSSESDKQFPPSKALKEIKLVDEGDVLPTPRMSTKKPISRNEVSKIQNTKVSNERHSYLKHLRDLFFDKKA